MVDTFSDQEKQGDPLADLVSSLEQEVMSPSLELYQPDTHLTSGDRAVQNLLTELGGEDVTPGPSGGMCNTQVCRMNGGPVLAKYYNEHFGRGKGSVQKILREYTIQTFLKSVGVAVPSTSRMFGADPQIDCPPGFVMELCETSPGQIAPTLRKKIIDENNWTVEEAVVYFSKALDTLTIMSQYVVHRDLNPANLLVTEDDNPVVTDFGLSALLHNEEFYKTLALIPEEIPKEKGIVLTTPVYASPQQLFGDKRSEQDDVYAIGVTLYEMLVGESPFDNEAGIDLVSEKQNTYEIEKVVYSNIGKNNPLAEVVLRCLAPQTEDRFSNMETVKTAFNLAVNEIKQNDPDYFKGRLASNPNYTSKLATVEEYVGDLSSEGEQTIKTDVIPDDNTD